MGPAIASAACHDGRQALWLKHHAALERVFRAPEPFAIDVDPTGRKPPIPRWTAEPRRPEDFRGGFYRTRPDVCPLCGQRDIQPKRARWHPECVSLWKIAHNASLVRFPPETVCELTGAQVGFRRSYEVDHRVPLHHVRKLLLVDVAGRWRRAWAFWSVFNLRAVRRGAHRAHSAQQMRDLFEQRARERVGEALDRAKYP